jgi:hypothetical protein
MHDVADALKDARSALKTAEDVVRRNLRRKNPVLPTADTLRADPVRRYRSEVDEALRRLTRARHDALISIFAVALEEGMTIGELARNYGFSRQLAARYAKEARGQL